MPLFSDPAIINNMDCGDLEVCHTFIPGDKIYAQFKQTPCGVNLICDPEFNDVVLGSDLITNGTFTGSLAGWTAAGNWVYGTNDAVCTAGSVSELSQTGLGMTVGNYYRVTFDITRTAGSIRVGLGDGAGINNSAYVDTTGSYSIDIFYNDLLDDTIIFSTDDEFDGTLDNVTLQEVSYDCWSPTLAWNLSEDSACKSESNTNGDLVEDTPDYITAFGYYSLTFTITGYVSGTLVAYVANSTDIEVTTISGNGTYTLYYLPIATGVVKFTPSTDFIGCITEPDLRQLKNDHYAQIYDPVTDTVHATMFPSYFREFVTFAYDIQLEDELDFGCYLIGIFDLCQLEEEFLENGELVGGSGDTTDLPNIVYPSGWGVQGNTTDTYWSWDDNPNQFTAEVLVGNNSVTLGNWPSRLVMPAGDYEVSFDIVSIDPDMFVRFSLFGYGTIQSGQFTTVGTHTYQFTYDPDLDSYGLAQFQIAGLTALDTGGAVIDNLSILKIEPVTSSYTSECIRYAETAPKSRLFQGYCDDNAFGFEFTNSGFRLSERLVCRSFGPSFEKDKKVYNHGSGTSGVYYSEVTKWFAVYLDAYPESVHDFMALTIDCDHFSIGTTESDLTEYVAKVDDYQPEWDRSGIHSLATARFECKPKEDGQLFSRNC